MPDFIPYRHQSMHTCVCPSVYLVHICSTPGSAPAFTPVSTPTFTLACTAAYTLASKYMSSGWVCTCEVCLSAMGMSPILLGNHRIGLAGKAWTRHLFAG